MYKQRVTIIGNYLSFRKLLFDAVNEKLEERIPFLHNPVISLHNFHEDFTLDDQELLNEMFSAIGLHIVQEPMLTQHIKELPQTDVDDDYTVACLLMTFIAVAIPELAQSENSRFNVNTFRLIFSFPSNDNLIPHYQNCLTLKHIISNHR